MKNFIVFAFIILIVQNCQWKGATSKHRKKRFYPALLFPVTSPTRTQFIGGIGIPLEELTYESLITGYVFKAEYQIAYDAEQLRVRGTVPVNTPIEPYRTGRQFSKRPLFKNFLVGPTELQGNPEHLLRQRSAVLSSYRWSVYKALEGLANRLRMNGRECVLKSICEAAEEPFHVANGLFAELFHILLTPSSSVDKLSEHADNEYFHAEITGRSGASCDRVFNDCPRSLLSRFSEIRHLEEEYEPFFG